MIKLNIASRQFAPGWFATVLVLLLVPAMCALAHWQYGRAQEKRVLQQQVEQRIQRPARAFAELRDDLPNQRYQTIRITGRYDTEHQFLLDNQPREWQSGYAIITPLLLHTGELVLVNRGWVVQPPSREVLPALDIAQPLQTIQGKIDLPGKAFGLGQMTLEQGWPLRIQYLDYAAIAEVLGKPVLPLMLRLDADQPDGYDRHWQPASIGPMKHYGYMFQWLAMAVAVLVLYISLNLNKRERDDK